MRYAAFMLITILAALFNGFAVAGLVLIAWGVM
jgi:hypothetical protein